MSLRQLFARKSIERLHAEMEGGDRLHRVLGPISLTSLGVGAVIGAGIFVMTGRVAAEDAGPAIVLSYIVAATACAFAALCYAEFASMAPVAGSAYTYAYATLGELLAWIIGWDLILEYGMSCATVASAWSQYFDKLLEVAFGVNIPAWLQTDPITHHANTGSYLAINVPALAIMALITWILIIGIRESALFNNAMVILKTGVVLFVIAAGIGYVNLNNLGGINPSERILPGERSIGTIVGEHVERDKLAPPEARERRLRALRAELRRQFKLAAGREEIASELQRKRINEDQAAAMRDDLTKRYALPANTPPEVVETATSMLPAVNAAIPEERANKLGMFGALGLDRMFSNLDDSVRSPFLPYGASGVFIGAALVFFAFIGFDSISTHAEEAKNPARDIPFGIIASLVLCGLLYVLVAGVIAGMERYPDIDPKAAIATAFDNRAKALEADGKSGGWLKLSSLLIAAGGLAGMTSVLLVTFLSQSRVFLAMARDGLLPESIFGAVHPVYKTPHISTFWTGVVVSVVAAVTPISMLEEMVNIGTLFAFAVVCAAVLLLRIQRPDARRPFRCPALWIIAPLGVFANVVLMLFLQVHSWQRLVVWLALGLVIYFAFGFRHSVLGKELAGRGASPASGG
jgi:APA family basic amino acid/polyamine antiporter